MDTVLLVLGLIMFVSLVVLHELGHAIIARRNGVIVREFGVGFPPRAWKRKLKNGVLFTINWLPVGGFVRLKGEHDAADKPGTYGNASLWVKVKILLAGVMVNWLTAVVIFTILALIGMPKIFPNQFAITSDTVVSSNEVIAAAIIKDSPAENAGVKAGDVLVSLDTQPITNAQQLMDLAKSNAGKEVKLEYSSQGQVRQTAITLNNQQSSQGYLGVSPQEKTTLRSTWSAPIVGVGVTVQFTYETLKGLWVTITQLSHAQFAAAGENVVGPIGIFAILKDSSSAGFASVLFLIGIISLTLAVMNALPIPALDGGRLFVTLLFRIFKRPLTKERESKIQLFGFVAIMLLVALVTFVDVKRFFG